MKKLFFGALAALTLAAGGTFAGTLDDVKARGSLLCGVSTGAPGFATVDDSGKDIGFDVDYCRAVAAAIFGDPMAVKFVGLTSSVRFTALAAGEVDILARNTTWTYSRDTDLKQTFLGVNYYDGQGFMVKKELGVSSAKELDGATVCVQVGTTTELNLSDFFKENGMSYEPVPTADNAESQQQYLAGACDTYTTDASALHGTRVNLEKPDDHLVLPEIISKEPLGPLVRHGDDNWALLTVQGRAPGGKLRPPINWSTARCQSLYFIIGILIKDREWRFDSDPLDQLYPVKQWVNRCFR